MTDVAEIPLPARTQVRRKRHTRWRRFKRWVRHHKALSVLIGTAVVLLVILLIWLLWILSRLGDVTRFPTDLGDDRPPRVAGPALNVLLVGVDDPTDRDDLFEMLESGRWEPGAYRSDVIMVAHLSGDRRTAQVVSIPRDSFVDVPGEGRTKINAAFSRGGPSLLGRTVESLTGTYIDHVAVVDFDGFSGVVDAVGGVDILIPSTVYDPHTGLTWTQGHNQLDGEAALRYVRQRKGLPRGDFDRIERQQNVLRSMLGKVTSTGVLANPLKVSRMVARLDSLVAVSDTLDDDELRSLVLDARKLKPALVRFVTIPTTGTPTIDGASVVTVDFEGVSELFTAVRNDRFEDWYSQQAQVDELGDPEDVR